MPEGDTIHNLARTLQPLVGQRILRCDSQNWSDALSASLAGVQIASIEARAKNLLIHLTDRRCLHLHLRMWGRVWLERPRSSFWSAPQAAPQLRLQLERHTLCANRLPVLRLLRADELERAPDLTTLGPDLLAPRWSPDAARDSLRALGSLSIGEALLRQRGVAGIGNVYKSELLFLAGIDPRTPLAQVTDAALSELLQSARNWMQRNTSTDERRRWTRASLAGPRLWVYGRHGRACLRCARGTIERLRQGREPGRWSYFCPICQPASPPARPRD